ncbi:VanZ family protein [Undibacterium sp. Rencai35W]|uniref:VanZ family protein n=1 Tax=Undibacterium sp. Rencai35W TaxID=3413046 RepID=UPI003BF4554D
MMFPEIALFVFASAVICVGCLVPASWLPPIRNDKWMHFIAFAGLSVLARLVVHSNEELVYWFAGLLLAGLLIEILQHWVPGRQFCWRDMAANTAGVGTIASLLFFYSFVDHVG